MRALILCLALVVSGRAHAGSGAGVVVTGESTLQPQLVALLETWLRDHGYALVSSPLSPEGINRIIDCGVLGDDACAPRVVDRLATSGTVVWAKAEVTPAADGMRNVTLNVNWYEKGRTGISDRRFCERCNEQSLRDSIEDLMGTLARKSTRGLGRLELTSSPEGARVVIDGVDAGVTPLALDFSPGNHKIELVFERHAPETREIVIAKGETATLDVTLNPHDTKAATPSPTRIRPVPLAVTAGGAALLVTGAIMIAIDEDDSPTGPPTIRDTAPAGYALATIGGAAVAVGLYLWFKQTDEGPMVSASPHGGTVGWFARF